MFRPFVHCSLLGGAALFALVAASGAQASTLPIVGVTASSTFSTYDVNNLINGSGLSGGLHGGDFHTKWLTDGTVTGSLVFDLGAVDSIAGTTIWNYGPGCCGNERSVRDLNILTSTNGINYTAAGSYVLDQPSTDPFAGQFLAFAADAQYVKFDLLSNYGDANYTGLSEVRFSGQLSPAPLPPGLPMFAVALLGLAGAGAMRSRRAVSA